MRIALIADAFPPLRSSGAVQLRDLSREFARQGHAVTVLIASPELGQPWHLEQWDGIQVLRLRTPKTKDVNYVRRTVAEFFMPYAMLRNLRRSPLAHASFDGVVWYSPTIFLGPVARAIKARSACPSYLIIRDIFPEWAVDMGLMGRGLPYHFFKSVANRQYRLADVIGVQTPGNLAYFQGRAAAHANLEVLHNWLADTPDRGCSVSVQRSTLSGRKIFVYAGNMGIAQGMGILLDLAERLLHRADVGFLFVGRGSDARRLRDDAARRGLDNVIFCDEIDPDEIPGLYAQCHVGLVALDPRHKTHNIPGKFLSYMQASLPVLANINAGNDLVGLIQEMRVGRVCTDNCADVLAAQAAELLADLERDREVAARCKALAKQMFSPAAAVSQISQALEYERQGNFKRNFGRVGARSEPVGADEATPQYSSEL
ncbi:glycosyltransferase family 4 protein [Massilia agilis]|uniref:Glycosyltransferase family 4 protein n=1 Tax=Massilia agilis TaxID=1811226 RepID=A0ABT2D801_9BURK|nr:glycosyltransferase family 4 protein [Massilia agilis]MCS0807429.1 glycosyltransferase family 4 protein [Massilia agilis]